MSRPKPTASKATARASTGLALATTLHREGKLHRAEKEYKLHLSANPRDADALMMLGVLKGQISQHVAAVNLLSQAVALAPDSAPVHYNLGRALMEAKDPEIALRHFLRSIELAPGRADSHNNLGNAFRLLGRYDAAVAEYRRALAIDPRCPGASFNLGRALRHLVRDEEALVAFHDAAMLDPSDAQAHYQLGLALFAVGNHASASQAFAHTLKLAPDHRGAVGRLAYANQQIADWSRLADLHQRTVAAAGSRGESGDPAVTPYALISFCDDPATVLRCTGAAATPRSPDAAWFDPPAADPSRKIKLAYVAGDYREHATSYLIADVIEQHDRSRFEVVGVSFGPSEESPMATRMRSAFDQFLEVRSYSDLVIAELMRNAGIDIAIDLVGFNQYARMGIFAKRAAPIQVNYLGWPSTTGATYMDYIIADPIVVPDAERKHYAEAVVRLPESYQPNDRKRVVSDQIPTREASGLPKSGAVFCCFNNTFKILPPVFDSWMRILAAVDGSVLWLLEDAAVTSNNFRREAEARSISPDRLVFAPRLPLAQHLARHRLADVFLDTTPYNAHTTASDSLWCEVPVVTLPGRTFSARVAASLVTAVGLPNLVASSRGDYEALAIDLATSPERLAAIKQHLRKARSSAPLFDAPRTARHLETAYATMWQRYLDRQLPSGFDVAPLG